MYFMLRKLFYHLEAVHYAKKVGKHCSNVREILQRELGVCSSSSDAHRADSEGVSRYAYGYASKVRVVVAYREIEYRGTFYLEEAVASAQGFYCTSRVMQSETKKTLILASFNNN